MSLELTRLYDLTLVQYEYHIATRPEVSEVSMSMLLNTCYCIIVARRWAMTSIVVSTKHSLIVAVILVSVLVQRRSA